ncbi:exopolysaccharide biosynthesis polyprenyl glycosylphosphotransferase [Candidatus Saccharibacteria bacterium]|nr:exopolysaccharide biosynthesis polyprenyl glycosylphosphotransferase [Candidatus Saccharibacteria bacterium]
MKKDSTFVSRLCLVFGDIFAIIFSFFGAYYFRTHLDSRPFFFVSDSKGFLLEIILLIPVWILILGSLGLYSKNILARHARAKEIGRLLVASIVGLMAIISVDYFGANDLFPVRTIPVYSFFLCFFFLVINRTLFRQIRDHFFRKNRGTLRAVIIGNNKNTDFLADYISSVPESGYRLVGIVASRKYFPKDLLKHQYPSLKDAIRYTRPDVIFQTDERQTEYVYKQTIEKHLLYYFVPSEASMSSQLGQLELVGSTPAIRVSATPLLGNMKYLKRFFDIFLGGFMLILALIPMIILWIIIKISSLKNPAIYSEIRLSQFNRKFKIYKFRSMKPEFSGMSPEEAFKKMGRPELIKKYRKNGDFLPDDPRITRIGRFIRSTSLDELPQLFNVVRGDISLVGPRALVPGELRKYGDRSLLLTVKSGLTGLAQVSGRRNISFEERRALDLYYIKNWSIALDFQILLRTVKTVLIHEGAK